MPLSPQRLLPMLFLVSACGGETLRYNGIHIGADVDALKARHPDAEKSSAANDELAAEHLDEVEGAEAFLRQPREEIEERYFFKDGQLAGAMVVVKDRALLDPIVALLESENGPPHDRRTIGNSTVKMWHTSDAELVVLSFSPEQSLIMLKPGEGGASNPVWFGAFVFLYLVGIANLVTVKPVYDGFTRKFRFIDTAEAIAALQSVAKRSMYGALVQIGVLGLGNALFLYGYVTDQLDGTALLVNLALNGIVLGVAKKLEREEYRIRETSASPELQMQVAEINETWVKKALPTF